MIVNREYDGITLDDIMMDERESLGKVVTNQDKIIKDGLDNLINKEKEIIHEYKVMNQFKDKFTPEFNNSLIDEIEKRKLFLLYKMQSKETQYDSLIKLIEYLSFLDNKKKNVDIENIRNKLMKLEEDLIPYKELFQ
tara:strand:+ start:161 stop:571 length:411 start_codon:yes stop_codon:yes gene_type:complete